MKKKKKNHNISLLLMLLPGGILAMIYCYIPLPGILLAFKKLKFHGNIFQSFFKSDWVGLRNFRFLFNTPDAWMITRNTVLYNLSFIVITMVLAITLAIALNELRNRGLSKIYQTIFLLPYFLSWVIIAYLCYSLLSFENGIVNNILTQFGLERINWYFEPSKWPGILIFSNTWKTVGFEAIIYLAAIVGIDPMLYEAAQIDGASKWQQIKYITIPSITTLITILFILAIGKTFRADFGLFFNVPLNMGSLRATTEVIDTYVYKIMKNGDYGMAAAAGLYQGIVGFILVMVTNKIVKKINPENSLF